MFERMVCVLFKPISNTPYMSMYTNTWCYLHTTCMPPLRLRPGPARIQVRQQGFFRMYGLQHLPHERALLRKDNDHVFVIPT
jgi:hypothetical protein